ncbi:Type 1 glutamine amidotransferase-like domain-containing protein [Bacillus salitolerans]|uniref:Type 1 glutamine amidotransferase-like domain-containing protein n=1 Tax=Bacillus salitolerans TaxID=1437434 RepID=A0ABW4LW94_9BACI
MGTLILSGGGNATNTKEINQYFVKRINEDKPLLYIPIAGNEEIRSYEENVNYIRSIFNPLGLSSVQMWTDVARKNIEDINRYSAVYIGGGNTLSLLKRFKRENFDKVLKEYYNNGGIIYGQSAGSIIFGKEIAHTCPEHSSKENTQGLNLVNNHSVWCHYSKEEDIVIKEYITRYNYSFFLIPEGSAIVVNEGEIFGIGKNAPMYMEK